MGWVAEQHYRSAKVPPSEMTPILTALSSLNAVRIVQTEKPDTCGLNPAAGIAVVVHYSGHRSEYLLLGKETQEQGRPTTYLSISHNKGVYLVENALRAVFSKTLDDFRKAAAVSFHTSDVNAFLIETRLADTLEGHYEKDTERWHVANSAHSISNDSVVAWLAHMEKLPKLPFADLFDETHEGKQLFSRIRLDYKYSPDPLWIYIYKLNALSLPEELPELKPNDPRLAPYALYFSPYPTNYYALSDTNLLRKICRPF
jgi:hypothetical protein